MSFAITVAPSSDNLRAIDLPMPLPAPVTMAVFISFFIMCQLFVVVLWLSQSLYWILCRDFLQMSLIYMAQICSLKSLRLLAFLDYLFTKICNEIQCCLSVNYRECHIVYSDRFQFIETIINFRSGSGQCTGQ